MTLILTSLLPKNLLITADGRSTVLSDGVVTKTIDTYQKIFPVAEHPVAIFQHGENRLDGQPIANFINRFLSGLNAGNHTIEEIADELRHFAHAHVRARFTELKNAAFGCGLCVAGFSTGEEARMVELFWKQSAGCLITEERQWTPTAVIPSGDGQRQIDAVSWRKIENQPISAVQRYHQALLDQAIQAKIKQNSVGGHVHELLITPVGWKWMRPPAQPAK